MVNEFDNQLRDAISKHGEEHIDIIVVSNRVYGVYQSATKSFEVTDNYPLIKLGGLDALKKYELEFKGLCICFD